MASAGGWPRAEWEEARAAKVAKCSSCAPDDAGPARQVIVAKTLEPIMAKARMEFVTGCAVVDARGGGASGDAAQDQRGVGAAEAERVRQYRIDLALLRRVRHEIDRR